jgi:hypothetical protein
MGKIDPKRPLDAESYCCLHPPQCWSARYGDLSTSNQERAIIGSPAITEQAARAIGVDAYLYFYPLISVDITRKQSANIEARKAFGKGR